MESLSKQCQNNQLNHRGTGYPDIADTKLTLPCVSNLHPPVPLAPAPPILPVIAIASLEPKYVHVHVHAIECMYTRVLQFKHLVCTHTIFP